MFAPLRTSYHWLRYRGMTHLRFQGYSPVYSCHYATTLARTNQLTSVPPPGTVAAASQERSFCRVTDSRCTDLYMEELFEAGVGDEDPFDDFRNILYPNVIAALDPEAKKHDPLYRLCYASSMGDVLEILESIGSENLTPNQSTQALSTLFHIQKFSAYVVDYIDETHHIEIRAEFNRVLREQDGFIRLVDSIRGHIPEVPLCIASYLFMCLRRMEHSLTNQIMQDLVIHLKRNISHMDSTALSYFCVGLRGRNLYKSRLKETTLTWYITLAPAMPKIRELVNNFNTHEEAKKIAIILNTTARLVNDDVISIFMKRIVELVEAGEFNSDASLPCLVKVLSLYISIRDWHMDKANITRTILYSLRNRTHLLRPVQALVVSKVVSETFDPVSIFYELNATISVMYERQRLHKLKSMDEHEDFINSDLRHINSEDAKYRHFVPRIDFLQALCSANITKIPRETIEPIIWEVLNGPSLKFCIAQMFEIIRSSNAGSPEVIGAFLDRSFEVCKTDQTDLTRLGLRYLNFNSALGGIIRHTPFEKNMIDVFEKDLVETPFTGRFSIEFGFILGYAQTIPKHAFERFMSMVNQMNAFGIYSVCRGLEVRQNLKQLKDSRHGLPDNQQSNPEVKLLEDIEVSIQRRIREILETPGHDFSTYYTLLRSYLNRRRYMEETEFVAIIEDIYQDKFHDVQLSLSIVRQICVALKTLRPVFAMPGLVDKILSHVFDIRSHVHALTLVHILHLCFLTNHQVKNKIFLDVCSSCIIRDFDNMHTVLILESAIALAKYHALKKELVLKIFSPEFMDRADDEIRDSTMGYAKRLRRGMMELNRTVCLHYPEYKVPWFHDKYCQEEANKTLKNLAHSTTPFFLTNQKFGFQLHEDVYQSLCQTIGGPRFMRESVFSPYYNHIDFEVWQDENGHFLPLGETSLNLTAFRRSSDLQLSPVTNVQKFAIIVNQIGDYTRDTKSKVGLADLNEKNLERQGYTVISVSPHDWNAMNMSVGEAKNDFFKTKFKTSNSPIFPFSAENGEL